MAIKKQTAKKKPAKKAAKRQGYERSSHDAPTAKEMAETIKRAQDIASGKKKGAIIVVEQFEENGDTGIKGLTYWHGIQADARAQVVAASSGLPVKILAIMLMSHIGHDHD